jgi:phosphoenolpyruvate carboxykinase (ATP)
MVSAVIGGKLDDAETRQDQFFGLNVPVEVPGVDSALLDPRGTWESGEAYDEQATQLANLFRENFQRFEAQVSEEVRNAGPHSS